MIIEQKIIFFDFWLINAEMLHDKDPQELVEQYIKILVSSFIPVLTPKGEEEYQELFENS